MNSTPPPAAADSFRIAQPRRHLPAMQGVIDRRMLVNFRCDPAVLARLIPRPFRPQLVRGWGMAGICLIRLKHLRPRWLASSLGFTSENAAHRIAVEWDEAGQSRAGVFIPRRDTNSRLNHWAGSRLFPGVHHLARFDISEDQDQFKLNMHSDDEAASVRVSAHLAKEWAAGSVFPTLEEASAFFAAGSLGWSAGNRPGELDGLELYTEQWHMEPLHVDHVESTYFDNPNEFPPGTMEFDSAILMRNIQHEWHARGRMICDNHHRLP